MTLIQQDRIIFQHITTTSDIGDAILGTDIKFPLDVEAGRLVLTSGQDNVEQAIEFWIEVMAGEILWNRTKGIGIERYIHQHLDMVAATVPGLIEEGLMLWEPRVKKVRVTAEADHTKRVVWFYVEYTDISYGIPQNMTYELKMSKESTS